MASRALKNNWPIVPPAFHTTIFNTGGGPQPDPGYILLVDADGAYLVDADGAYLQEPI